MHPDATRSAQGSTAPVIVPTLYVALNSAAVVGSSPPRPGRPSPAVADGAGPRTGPHVERTRAREDPVPPRSETRVVSCHEVGRDGSWLHHALEAHGVRNHVVDSSSIEVNRRQRRTKSDRLDARRVVALTTQLTVLERERTRLLKRGDSPALTEVSRLMQLRAVGVVTAWIYVMERFAWRTFRNRRELGR